VGATPRALAPNAEYALVALEGSGAVLANRSPILARRLRPQRRTSGVAQIRAIYPACSVMFRGCDKAGKPLS